MFEISGRCATAKVFADWADKNSILQVIDFLNHPYAKGSVTNHCNIERNLIK